MDTLLIAPPDATAPALSARRIDGLPFVVRPVHDVAEMSSVADLRMRAYGRHLPPELAARLGQEAGDDDGHVQVLVAVEHGTRRLLGTIRLQHNGAQPLPLERSITLPAWLQGRRLAEASRLAVELGVPPAVRWALFKAAYLYCVAHQVHWLVVTARRAAARMYEGLLMRDVLPPDRLVPMSHVGHLPHRVLALDVEAAPTAWRAHPMRDFMGAIGVPEIRFAPQPIADAGAPAPTPR